MAAHIKLSTKFCLKMLGTIHLFACLQILLFRNRDLSVIFADGGDGEGDQKISHFLWKP